MMLDDVLNNTVQRVSTATRSASSSVADLVADSAVTATGKTAKPVDSIRSAKSPAIAAAVLALAALGLIVVMRRVFSGAIS